MPVGKKSITVFDLLDKAVAKLAAFRAENRTILDQLAELEEEKEVLLVKAKAELKEQYAKKPSGEYEAFKGANTRLVVQAKWSREVKDFSAFKQRFPFLIEESVNLKKLDSMIENGELNKDEVAAFIERKPLTTAVSLKPVTDEEVQ